MMIFGCSQVELYWLLITMSAFVLSRLYALAVNCARVRPNASDFASRTSIWLIRLSNIVPGAIKLTSDAGVDSGRPSVGDAWTAARFARICGPGRFCQVALARSP